MRDDLKKENKFIEKYDSSISPLKREKKQFLILYFDPNFFLKSHLHKN